MANPKKETSSSPKDTSPLPEAELSWLERIEKVHEPGYMNWITASWTMMFIKQGILPAEDASEVARVVLGMWEDPVTVDQAGPHTYGADRHFIKMLGPETGGSIMMARTQPSMRQMLEEIRQVARQ